MLRLAAWLIALAVWIAAAACLSPPVEHPVTTVIQDTPVRVPQNAQNKVDVLFMVDNSPSMDAMQGELKNHFGEFFKVFTDLAAGGTFADLHIGVVTSDYGAGDKDGPTNSGCFASPGKTAAQGHLINLGAAAASTCMAPSVPYIEYAFDPKGGTATSNLPTGQDLVTTFTCMASVGSHGCGFEHQLESVYAALKNTNENKGFLRDDALLTVVFVTNEDDGSAPMNSQIYESSADPNTFGAYDTYRQTRFAVDCGGMPIPYKDGSGNGLPGTYTNCAAAPNPMNATNTAFDISRYINLFNQPSNRGGVKAVPSDVILFGINGPETPFETILAVAGTGNGETGKEAYQICPGMALTDTCLMRLQHSCQNNKQKAFFADPSIRLNAVINSAANHSVSSICGTDLNAPPDYTSALQELGTLISSEISPGCIPALLANVPNGANGQPDFTKSRCFVQDVTTNPDSSLSYHTIPECDASNTFPCWRIEAKDQCSKIQSTTGKPFSPQGVGMTIDRNGAMAPDHTTASVECETSA
jgi:hypothetical protein